MKYLLFSLPAVVLVCAAFLIFGKSSEATTTGSIILVDQPFRCDNYSQPLDLNLVKVTMTEDATANITDAINLNRGTECTGLIRRIEVDQWVSDGIKIGETAHDLVIESGYINCHAKRGTTHQDGVQALGGLRVTFQSVRIDCESANNAAWFMTRGNQAPSQPTEGEWPTDVVCDGCVLTKGGDADRVVKINASIRSGVRSSTVYGCGDGSGASCAGQAIDISPEAVDPVTVGTVVLYNAACNDTFDNDFDGLVDVFGSAGGDPQCSSVTDNDESQ